MSFRMIPFPPRVAMTTAELPEPLIFQQSEIILFKQILQRIDGPAARHSVCSVYSVDYKKFVFICVHSWFQINILY